MTKRCLFTATLLLAGALNTSLSAQAPTEIAGKAVLKSSGAGLPGVEITLCPESERQVVTLETTSPIPARDQIREIRIPSPGEPGPITIATVSAACPSERRTVTDNAGHFVFSGVEPGAFQVLARRGGYVGESLRGSPPIVLRESVDIKAQQIVPQISFVWIKAGSIAGTVRDANGRPLASADVQIVPAKGGPLPLATRQTDDRGQYRLFGLPPGEFLVFVRETTVTPGGVSCCLLTYHPSSLAPAEAKTVVLSEGEEISGIDVMLRLR